MNISSLSGMQAAVQLLDRTAITTASFAAGETDLAEQVANLATAAVALNANARVVHAQDETTQAVIDILA